MNENLPFPMAPEQAKLYGKAITQAVREGIKEYKDNLPEHHKRAIALADIEYSRQHDEYRRRTSHMPERDKHA